MTLLRFPSMDKVLKRVPVLVHFHSMSVFITFFSESWDSGFVFRGFLLKLFEASVWDLGKPPPSTSVIIILSIDDSVSDSNRFRRGCVT